MITIRKSAERGTTNIDWLDSKHSFSFGDYIDPRHVSFGPLRVINEDVVAPGGGFGTHPHRDMEIITYVVRGALEHKDSLGTGSIIRPGDVQRMTAGEGILHSEFNPSPSEPVHLLQIWIVPRAKGLPPSYEQKNFGDAARRGRLCLVAAGDGRHGALTIAQDADVYATRLDPNQSVNHKVAENRLAWLQVVSGELTLNNTQLKAGDGAAVQNEPQLNITAGAASELLLFDLPSIDRHGRQM